MPELPEVETISRQLDQVLKGRKISRIEILSKKNFLGQVEDVIGRKIVSIQRRAKIILIKLDDSKYLAIHLKLTGQLIYSEGGRGVEGCKEKKSGPFRVCELPNKFTTIVVSFNNGGKLYFNDLRKFGWMRIVSQKSKVESRKFKLSDSLDETLGLEKFGPEANDKKSFTLDYFRQVLGKSKKPVKLVIMDQEKLAGVGNIYANEALYVAGVMPTRPANSLKEEEIKTLRYWILRVLEEAIKHKGTSDTDEAYRQITGEKGDYQNYLQVYGRKGQKCSKCGGEIKWMKVGGRGTFFCGKCQR